jgi:hypothetical protein
MKILATVCVAGLLAASLACGGYSSSNTPPGPGTTPTIVGLSPDNVNSGSADFVLTVNGSSFTANAAINWNGVKQITTPVVAGTQLTTTIPASAVASSGTATVTVTNPGTAGGQYGGGTLPVTSNSMTFTIN